MRIDNKHTVLYAKANPKGRETIFVGTVISWERLWTILAERRD